MLQMRHWERPKECVLAWSMVGRSAERKEENGEGN